jgi:hypothetical protein
MLEHDDIVMMVKMNTSNIEMSYLWFQRSALTWIMSLGNEE